LNQIYQSCRSVMDNIFAGFFPTWTIFPAKNQRNHWEDDDGP
jgi:hypothetical protein